MKALWKKDHDWLLFFAAAGIVTMSIVHMEHGFVRAWVLPSSGKLEEHFIAWAIAGAVFGLFAAIRDELSGTSEFLVHRPVARELILWTRLAACAVVLLAWLLVPWMLCWGYELARGDDAPAGRPELALTYSMVATVGWATFALAFFAGSLRVGVPMRALLFGTIVFPMVLGGGKIGALSREALSSIGPMAAFYSVCTVLLVAAARAGWMKGNDLDHPLESRTRRWAVPIVAVGTSFFASWSLGALQGELEMSYWRRQPALFRNAEGEFVLGVRSGDGDGRHWRRLGEDGAVGKELRSEGFEMVWADTRCHWQDFDMGWAFPRSRRHVLSTKGYQIDLYEDDGYAHVFRRGDPDRGVVASSTRVGRGPGNEPFSDHAFDPMSRRVGLGSVAWVADLQDGRLYRFEPGRSEHFEHVPLPQGDRIVGRHDSYDSATWSCVLRGEKGDYRLEEEGPVPAVVADDGEESSRSWEPYEVQTESDGVRALVTVRPEGSEGPASGEPVLERSFAPSTPTLQALALLLQAVSLARGPVLELAATLAPPDSRLGSIDPLVAGFRRPLLTLLSLALGALLAWRIRAVLLQRGAHARTARLWGLLTVLFGVVAAILALAIENRRAYRRPALLESPQRPLLAPGRRAS